MNLSKASNWNDQNRQCYIDGESQALTEIYKHLWKDYYMEHPTNQMMSLEEGISQARIENRRGIVMITFNFNETEIWDDEATKWVRDMCRRTWMKPIKAWWECMNKDGEYTHPHVHMVAELIKGYSPAQIGATLYQGKGARHFGSPQAIDVKKHPMKDRDYLCEGYPGAGKKIPNNDDIIFVVRADSNKSEEKVSAQ